MPKIYSNKQATQFIGLSRQTLLTLRKQGKIAFIQITPKRIAYLESDLQAFIEKNRHTGDSL